MRSRRFSATVFAATLLLHACVSANTRATEIRPVPEPVRGIASWYGEEFAGRATANGEIYDPHGMTAAHLTLPFGTVVEVSDRRTGKAVVVRINDRGPYVGKRIIDLSYGAAQQIGLDRRGIGEVDVRVISVGDGKRYRKPPVVMASNKPTAETPAARVADPVAPPEIDFPLPPGSAPVQSSTAASSQPLNTDDFRVEVTEARAGEVVRKQVSADGTTLEVVGTGIAVEQSSRTTNSPSAPAFSSTSSGLPTSVARKQQFVVQAGAFAARDNAAALRDKLRSIDATAHIQAAEEMHRVRIGPYATREEAIAARGRLESAGLSGLVLTLEQ